MKTLHPELTTMRGNTVQGLLEIKDTHRPSTLR